MGEQIEAFDESVVTRRVDGGYHPRFEGEHAQVWSLPVVPEQYLDDRVSVTIYHTGVHLCDWLVGPRGRPNVHMTDLLGKNTSR